MTIILILPIVSNILCSHLERTLECHISHDRPTTYHALYWTISSRLNRHYCHDRHNIWWPCLVYFLSMKQSIIQTLFALFCSMFCTLFIFVRKPNPLVPNLPMQIHTYKIKPQSFAEKSTKKTRAWASVLLSHT